MRAHARMHKYNTQICAMYKMFLQTIFYLFSTVFKILISCVLILLHYFKRIENRQFNNIYELSTFLICNEKNTLIISLERNGSKNNLITSSTILSIYFLFLAHTNFCSFSNDLSILKIDTELIYFLEVTLKIRELDFPRLEKNPVL